MFVLWRDRQLWVSAEPLEALKAASQELAGAWPPTLIIHGELDGVVPVAPCLVEWLFLPSFRVKFGPEPTNFHSTFYQLILRMISSRLIFAGCES